MAQETEKKDTYVYLDFQGKDTSTILRQEGVYFRMLNLSENKPIVEICDEVYEGTYDDVVGTNLFFEEIPDPPPKHDLFETPTPLALKFLLKQTKILKLKKIGTRQKILINTPDTESVNINIKDDYRILLEKFENNKLNIDEYIFVEEQSEEDKTEPIKEDNELNSHKWELSRSPPRQNLTSEWYKPAHEEQAKTVQTNPINLQYIKLQKIAEQPSKHRIEQEIANYNEEPISSIHKNNFIIWKNLMMRKVEQQIITVDVRRDKIEGFVDIEQSIKDNVILPSSESPRVFTKQEKSRLLSFENFVNVSPLMKVIMLQDYEDMEKASIDQMSAEELKKIGQDGLTAEERYNLIKTFKDELKNYLIARLREEYEMVGGTLESMNLDVFPDNDINHNSTSSSDDDSSKSPDCVSNSESE